LCYFSTVHGGGQEDGGGQRARSIWVIGKNGGLSESEAARSIVEEARNFIQVSVAPPKATTATQQISASGTVLPLTSSGTKSVTMKEVEEVKKGGVEVTSSHTITLQP
jgi:hypothetical protein